MNVQALQHGDEDGYLLCLQFCVAVRNDPDGAVRWWSEHEWCEDQVLEVLVSASSAYYSRRLASGVPRVPRVGAQLASSTLAQMTKQIIRIHNESQRDSSYVSCLQCPRTVAGGWWQVGGVVWLEPATYTDSGVA